jgi:hypothetical protein
MYEYQNPPRFCCRLRNPEREIVRTTTFQYRHCCWLAKQPERQVPFRILRQAGLRARELMVKYERESDPSCSRSFKTLLYMRHHKNGYGQLSDISLGAEIDLSVWYEFFRSEVERLVKRDSARQARRARHARRHPQRKAA